ncbi:MAG: lysoplasmalogenase [Clostridiales bacterium]|jgi:uncharacterized membrane protein YhhN|nr:lysoplasmalogenase [Clostridiales bacterium]
MYYLIPVAVYSVFFAALSAMFSETAPKLRLILKSAASLMFVVGGAVFTFCYASAPSGKYIFAALALGGAGDILLGLHSLIADKKKHIVPNAAGGLCFLAGHIVYIVLFLGSAQFNLWLLASLPLTVIMLFVLKKNLKKPSQNKILIPLAIYSVALWFMCVSALNMLISVPSAGNVLIFVGAILFAASDYLLAIYNFAAGSQKKINIFYAVMLCYCIAQWLFVYAVICR